MSQSSPGSNEDDEAPECRICRESTGNLVPSCRCNTVVHAECLHRWLGYRADALFPLLSATTRHVCEVCRHPIHASVRATWEASACSTSSSQPKELATLLLPRAIVSHCMHMCERVFTVESCLFIFLFVLAIMGHALFVLGVYRGVSPDEHSLKRVALALANAVVTFSLLVFVQKVAMRWLREADYGSGGSPFGASVTGLAAAAGGGVDTVAVANGQLPYAAGLTSASDVEAQSGFERYASRCTTFSQVLLGAFLSVIAAAEIFFLVMQLPLGGLA